MTETEYLALAARPAARGFAFFRVRGGAETRFLPGGASLRFANMAADTLSIPSCPAGFLSAGDSVRVEWRGTAVFLGSVDTVTEAESRGDGRTQSVVCAGPWAAMSRMTLMSQWNSADGYVPSTRLILNQGHLGEEQTLDEALREICWGQSLAVPAACGFTMADSRISVSTLRLPFDECRDITVADAIRRELRLFPSAVVRFDYSSSPPAIHIVRESSAADAAYVASVPKTARERTYSAHPITGVDLVIETVSAAGRSVAHQTAGDTSVGNADCLRAAMQLAGAESGSERRSLKVRTEPRPELTSKAFWKKHSRLANVATDAFEVSEAGYSGHGWRHIANCSAEELKAAGKNAEVESFHCLATISGTDDVEHGVYIEMKFVTTDFDADDRERTIEWTVSSYAVGAETVPAGLAAAILAERTATVQEDGSELVSERMAVRLGDAWPTVGDGADGLTLQQIDIDCDSEIASLQFGRPEHLSPGDMASLLSGFRNRRRAWSASSRVSGKPQDDEPAAEEVAIAPISTTEWAPGTKSKTTVKASDGSTGSMLLDSAELESGETVRVHELKTGTVGSRIETAKVLSTADISWVYKMIRGGQGILVTELGGVITISATGHGGESGGGSGGSGESGESGGGFTGEVVAATAPRYDESTHRLLYTPVRLVFSGGACTGAETGAETVIAQAVEESA